MRCAASPGKVARPTGAPAFERLARAVAPGWSCLVPPVDVAAGFPSPPPRCPTLDHQPHPSARHRGHSSRNAQGVRLWPPRRCSTGIRPRAQALRLSGGPVPESNAGRRFGRGASGSPPRRRARGTRLRVVGEGGAPHGDGGARAGETKGVDPLVEVDVNAHVRFGQAGPDCQGARRRSSARPA
jgi:hypothetical protein